MECNKYLLLVITLLIIEAEIRSIAVLWGDLRGSYALGMGLLIKFNLFRCLFFMIITHRVWYWIPRDLEDLASTFITREVCGRRISDIGCFLRPLLVDGQYVSLQITGLSTSSTGLSTYCTCFINHQNRSSVTPLYFSWNKSNILGVWIMAICIILIKIHNVCFRMQRQCYLLYHTSHTTCAHLAYQGVCTEP